MNVIILAAGQGSRLRPHTDNKPKCLVEVEGISLLDRQLAVLRANPAVSKLIIVGGYCWEALKGRSDVLLVNEAYLKTNMVYSLHVAREFLKGDVLISYGDIVYSGEILDKLVAFEGSIGVAIDKGWEAYWRARCEDPLDDAETLKMDASGLITEIGRKPSHISEIEGQYMGLMKLDPEGAVLFADMIRDAFSGKHKNHPIHDNAYLTDLLMALIESGAPVSAVCHNEPWAEVDTNEDLILPETLRRLRTIKDRQS